MSERDESGDEPRQPADAGAEEPREGAGDAEASAAPDAADERSEGAEPERDAEPSAETGDGAETAAPTSDEAAAKGGDAEGSAATRPPGADLDPIAIEAERELTAEERARVEAEAEERAKQEEAATAEAGEEEPAPRGRAAVTIPGDALIQATGKRKRSVARVILRPGQGRIEVNQRSLEDYFPRDHHRSLARQPLVASGCDDSVDVWVRVHGGGTAGQAGAIRHGIARALCVVDPELRGELKRRGLLTRDARQKERRKAGLKKARKRPQFSKR